MAARAQVRLRAADRRKQILEVATRLFARQGFRGTTTRQVADAARVNEALIFRHFPTKDDLYWGVLNEKVRSQGAHKELSRRLEGSKDLHELFTALAEDLLQRDVTLSRLLWFSALENHRLAGRFFKTYVAKYYEELAEHVRLHQSRGEFRKVDPLLAARGFLGMVAYHFLIQELFGAKRYQKFDCHKVSETMADIWLTGVTAERPSRNGAGEHARDARHLSERSQR